MDAERARLFVALELPEPARGSLERWRARALREVRGMRFVVPEALHATLCFLGWRTVDEIEPVGAACASALGGFAPPALRFGEVVWLPTRRPRVLAVALDDPSRTLARIQAALSAVLSAGGWYAPESRPFLGHVTVARVAGRGRVRPAELAPPPAAGFEGAAVTLYRSHLGRAGARYEALKRIALPAEPSTPPEVEPLVVVREFHLAQGRAYAGGDLDELRPWLADDVVWHVPGRSRIAGEHRGIEAVLAYFDARRAMTDDTFRVSVRGVSAIGDRVVQLAGGSAVRDGRSVVWETVGVFRIADGRIAECWLVPFDLYEFDRIWG